MNKALIDALKELNAADAAWLKAEQEDDGSTRSQLKTWRAYQRFSSAWDRAERLGASDDDLCTNHEGWAQFSPE